MEFYARKKPVTKEMLTHCGAGMQIMYSWIFHLSSDKLAMTVLIKCHLQVPSRCHLSETLLAHHLGLSFVLSAGSGTS